jgi:hypothetical protein
MTMYTGTITSSDASGQTATTTVNINSVTTLTVVSSVTPQSGPPGTKFTITATSQGGQTPYNYSISTIGGLTPTPISPGVWNITFSSTAATSLQVLINGQSAGTVATSLHGAYNAGQVVGALTVSGGTQTTPITISGPDAPKFTISNGGMVPCNLVAAQNLSASTTGYSISLSVS